MKTNQQRDCTWQNILMFELASNAIKISLNNGLNWELSEELQTRTLRWKCIQICLKINLYKRMIRIHRIQKFPKFLVGQITRLTTFFQTTGFTVNLSQTIKECVFLRSWSTRQGYWLSEGILNMNLCLFVAPFLTVEKTKKDRKKTVSFNCWGKSESLPVFWK